MCASHFVLLYKLLYFVLFSNLVSVYIDDSEHNASGYKWFNASIGRISLTGVSVETLIRETV